LAKSSLIYAENSKISPRGNAVLYKDKGFLYLYNLQTKIQKKLIELPEGNDYDYAVSPTLDKYVVSLSYTSISDAVTGVEIPSKVTIYDIQNNVVQETQKNYFSIDSIQWSPNGKFIGYLFSDGGWNGPTKLVIFDDDLHELDSYNLGQIYDNEERTKGFAFSAESSSFIFSDDIANPQPNNNIYSFNRFYTGNLIENKIQDVNLVGSVEGGGYIRGISWNTDGIFFGYRFKLYKITLPDKKIYYSDNWSLSDLSKKNTCNTNADTSNFVGLFENQIVAERNFWYGCDFIVRKSHQLYLNNLPSDWLEKE
jgi:hypothetical protein